MTEIYRALELEKRYSKDQILESYLNRICLGQSCYGVEAAARTYFGKSASELTLAQSASLIGITNNPSQFGPFEGEWSREQNRERELLILDAMLEAPWLMRSPIVRNGNKVTVGYCPQVWEQWIAAEK